jgi:hypothetical protein
MMLAGNTVVDSNVPYLWIMTVQSTATEVLDIGHIMQWTGFMLRGCHVAVRDAECN